jgi:signal transduction histidine kinase
MTSDDDDLYTRHQMLAALVNVLVHDLRNPLHSATLLIEAMGSPSADVEALRTKLRGQIGKIDGLIAQTTAGMKELAQEPRVETIAIDELLRSIVERYVKVTARATTFELPAASGLDIAADRRMLERAAIEIAAVIAERQRQPEDGPPPRVLLTVDEPEPGTVCLRLGDLQGQEAEATAKAPLTISGGGIRLAVARSLAQRAGATLRVEQIRGGPTRFALLLPQPTADESDGPAPT